jgi:hypothetical protein
MSTPNRAAILTKTHKVLKRFYKHTPLKGDQPVMESLLFACCLENARYDAAQQAFVNVQAAFFDWNEIRVSTVKELAEAMDNLPEPLEAGARLKGVLQSVFESDYSFDLEQLKKQNIGAAVKRLQKLQGATPFNVAYATQAALYGHSIPVEPGTRAIRVGRDQRSRGEGRRRAGHGTRYPRARDRSSSLVARASADYLSALFAVMRDTLLSIADAKERFPGGVEETAGPPARHRRRPRRPRTRRRKRPRSHAQENRHQGPRTAPHERKVAATPRRKPPARPRNLRSRCLASCKPR